MWKAKLLFSFFLLFFSTILHGQISITGKILNDENGKLIANVSVYINNTTIGMTTGQTGEYSLRNIKPGVYEIIVSHVGYEKIVHRVEVKNEDLRFTFRLMAEVKQMRNIVIMTADLRKKWMQTFKQYFLGQTMAAERTRIKNEDDVLFEKGPSRNSMIAFSETPLIIENKELGYRVYFELVEFFYDQQQGRTYFFGFSRFEEINEEEGPKRKWKKNRESYYRGSTQHFYHSLLANDLEAQQFAIHLTKSMDTIKKKDSSVLLSGNVFRISSPTDNSPRVAFPVTVPDILYREDSISGKFYLKWEGDLQVRYKKDPFAKSHLQRKGHYDGFLPTGVRSGIMMLSSPAYLDPNGTLENPLSVQYSGYWSNERMASMLPIDYRPEGSQ